jgi:putative copper export protein
MYEWLTVLMRWIHLSSMATLVGGMIFGRLVMTHSMQTVSPESRNSLGDRAAMAYRPLVIAAVFGSIVSGIYKFLSTTGHSPLYHALFGIKMLLVLHMYAVAILIVQPKNERRGRMMTGVMISGLIIILISAWLSRIF